MAYTYRNKKTGEVIFLNRRAKSAFWEEEPKQEEPEQEEPEQEEPEQEEPEQAEATAEAPKKTTKSRGKK